MTLTGIVIRNIIRKLLTGQDYRSEIVTLLDAEFLQYVVDFFKRVACAKLDNKDITVDWYKKEFLSPDLFSLQEVAIHSGLKMTTLCALFQVPQKYYDQGNLPESQRESDFYLFNDTGEGFPCEVKLMGKGNPESADAVYARGSRVLVANTLSDLNKEQMDANGIFWVELKEIDDYKRFEQVLNALSIRYKSFTGDLQVALDKILPAIIQSDEIQDSVTPAAALRERQQEEDSSPQLLVEFE